MSNYTQLGFIKQTDGENEGTWGDALNENLIDLLDAAIGGYVEVSVASGNVTLAFADGTADNNGRHAVIKFTGSPGTTRTVTFPDAQVNYFIINGSDASVICTSGTGAATVTIPTGMKDIIYIDGSDEILSMFGTPHLSSSGNFTVDATTDIILDADGGDIYLKDGGTTFGELTNSSTDFVIKSTTSDKDIIFKGNDGGSAITALTLDMSAAGAATFNDKVVATELDISGDMDIDGTSNLDNTDIDGTLAVDGTTISLDATTSLNIDNSNTSNGITIGTATSGVPISIGHTTSETTINDNATVTGNLSVGGNFDVTGTLDLSDSNFTNAGDMQLDSITGDGDTDTSITFSGSDVITFKANNENQITINDGSILPVTDDNIDLGSSSYQFKDGYFDGTLEADAITVGGTAVATSGANTNISSIYNTSLAIGYGASHANIDFGTDNAIIFDIDGTQQIKVTDGAILPIADDDVDLGSSSYQFKNAYFDGTLEADAITIGGTAVTAGGATAGFALAMAVAL